MTTDKRQTVMVCDDEPDLLRMYSLALKKRYNILTADSGRSCIEKYMDYTLQGKKIDILLLDYCLPDMTGDDIACKIHELDGTRIIPLTAFELEMKKSERAEKKKLHNPRDKKAGEHKSSA